MQLPRLLQLQSIKQQKSIRKEEEKMSADFCDGRCGALKCLCVHVKQQQQKALSPSYHDNQTLAPALQSP